MKYIFLTLAVIYITQFQFTEAKLKEGECEVCIKFLTKFEKSLSDDDRKSQDKLTDKLKKACGKAKNKDNRFCYYVGGTKDAATYILKDITKPIGFYKPITSICEALKKKDPQTCELAYEKELDWKNINLKKMRVKQLKNILANWDETCSGCLEKSDYIKRIEEVKNRHVEL
ncbi:mesencephalic astrocyte-derived neurotrophic factor homolog [Clytia hemisphaerica]|uniref:Mesencephalic astrocyte-derived neurotrophic factor homolog n=1 Tax=Clytia hemisphaerica TaxID=252671 RepID=A0A7M5VF42_9CNID